MSKFFHWLSHFLGFDGGCGVSVNRNGDWACKRCGYVTDRAVQ